MGVIRLGIYLGRGNSRKWKGMEYYQLYSIVRVSWTLLFVRILQRFMQLLSDAFQMTWKIWLTASATDVIKLLTPSSSRWSCSKSASWVSPPSCFTLVVIHTTSLKTVDFVTLQGVTMCQRVGVRRHVRNVICWQVGQLLSCIWGWIPKLIYLG